MKHLTIYTDGACQPNPGNGGWAALLRCDGKEKLISGGVPDTTNNRMELMAVIMALEELTLEYDRITIFSDSKYVVDGINTWMAGWEKRGWRTASGSPVKNDDLWKILIRLKAKHNPKMTWVKGHGDNRHNNRVDQVAQQEAVEILEAA